LGGLACLAATSQIAEASTETEATQSSACDTQEDTGLSQEEGDDDTVAESSEDETEKSEFDELASDDRVQDETRIAAKKGKVGFVLSVEGGDARAAHFKLGWLARPRFGRRPLRGAQRVFLAPLAQPLDTPPACCFIPAQYLVYVSYYEIYNEYVYDLLVPPLGKKKRRAALRLGENDGDVYIRGTSCATASRADAHAASFCGVSFGRTRRSFWSCVCDQCSVCMPPPETPLDPDIREVLVESSTEALQVMAIGQKNRKIGCTRSNKQSSRSHCLLTVKVIRLDAFDKCQQLRYSGAC